MSQEKVERKKLVYVKDNNCKGAAHKILLSIESSGIHNIENSQINRLQLQ